MALRAPEPHPTFAEAANAALVELGWKPRSLYARYEIAGGALSQSTIENYLAGHPEPQIRDYDILAGVLNDALGEERFPRIPFRYAPRGDNRDIRGPNGIWGRARKLGLVAA